MKQKESLGKKNPIFKVIITGAETGKRERVTLDYSNDQDLGREVRKILWRVTDWEDDIDPRQSNLLTEIENKKNGNRNK